MMAMKGGKDFPIANALDTLSRVFAAGCAVFAIAGFLLGMRGVYEYIAVALVLVLSLLLVVISRKNVLLLVLSFFIAYANYSAMAANYFASYYDWYMYYAGTEYATMALYALLGFMSTLVLFFPHDVGAYRGCGILSRCTRSKWSLLFAIVVVCLLVVIFLTQSSGFSDTGGRAESNQLYEYSYIFFIVGYYFSGESKFCRRLLTVVAIIFLAQALFGGNRASVLAIALLLYGVYIAAKWPVPLQVFTLLIGFLFFQVVGNLRQDFGSVGLNEYIVAAADVFERGLIWDTAAAAYHQGIVYVMWLHSLDAAEVWYYVSQWFVGIFLGGSAVSDSNLSIVVQNIFGAVSKGGLGGGFLTSYVLFYFSIPGVLIAGWVISRIFSLVSVLDESRGDVTCMVTIALFCTVPRWWLYSLSPLTRGVLLMALVGCVACLIGGRGIEQRKGIPDISTGLRSPVEVNDGGYLLKEKAL